MEPILKRARNSFVSFVFILCTSSTWLTSDMAFDADSSVKKNSMISKNGWAG